MPRHSLTGFAPQRKIGDGIFCIRYPGYRLICNFGKSEYFCQRGFTDFWVICPSGRFVELIEKIDFHVHGLFDENFCDGGRSMRGFNPSGKSRGLRQPEF
jgi:hypothetical protein